MPRQESRVLQSNRKFLRLNNSECFYCGKILEGNDFTIDHVIDKQDGGYDDAINLVPACRNCNGHKSSTMIRRIGFASFLAYLQDCHHKVNNNKIKEIRLRYDAAKTYCDYINRLGLYNTYVLYKHAGYPC